MKEGVIDRDVGHERKTEYEQDVAPGERNNNRERNECAEDKIELVRGDPSPTGEDADPPLEKALDGVAAHRACAHHKADRESVLRPPERVCEFDERLKQCRDDPCRYSQSESDYGLVIAKIRATNGRIPTALVLHERRGHVRAIHWQQQPDEFNVAVPCADVTCPQGLGAGSMCEGTPF